MKRSICVLLLAGCASTSSSIPEPEALYHAANQRFAGKSISEMASHYGLPDEQTTFDGVRLYVWRANTTMQYRGRDRVATTVGAVGDLQAWPFASVPYRETTTSPTYETESYRCDMAAGVKDDGTVTGIRFMGKMGACQVFMP